MRNTKPSKWPGRFSTAIILFILLTLGGLSPGGSLLIIFVALILAMILQIG